ncbi:MAG TPA: carbohydrate ABC transporter permease [Propionibacteriaceae bacterium]|nr:carbohydrate ABC transporter permease [Propionibacteriaceae bacterium]
MSQSHISGVRLLPGRLVLTVYALILALPLLWMVISSFKPSVEVYGRPWSLPTAWKFENYSQAWEMGVSQYFVNSLVVTSVTTALVLVVAALAAYSLVRMHNWVARLTLMAVMGSLVISPQVSIVPLYDLLGRVGIIDTYEAMVLPYVAYRLPMAILLIRAVFLEVPRELEEASRLDGCGSFRTFVNVYWPVSSGVLATAAILTIYYTWNEFLFALIFVNSDELRTIPAGLMAFRDALATDWGVLLAGLTIAAVPIVVVFLLGQRFLIAGITAGSVKG